MIEIPQLDDMTYDKIMQKAIKRIPSMTEEWTDFNNHDPGITVLQTYAWLMDMLNYYMNATGDIHIQKYLKLIGITPKKAAAAAAYLDISAFGTNQILPAGTRFYAKDIPFEIIQDVPVHGNRMVSYINEVDGAGTELSLFAGQDGDYAEMFAEEPQKKCCAYFGFAKKLSGQMWIQFSVQEIKERNTVSDEFRLSSFRWEYYGKNGWTDIERLADGTNGFLRDGLVRFYIEDETVPFSYAAGMEEAHYLRCILRENRYDMLPHLGSVHVNPVFAVQKMTVCRRELLQWAGENTVDIPGYIEAGSLLLAGIEQADKSFRLICDTSGEYESACRIIDGEYPYRKRLHIDRIPKEKQESRIQVYIISKKFAKAYNIGTADGCASQKIRLDIPDFYELAITTKKKNPDGSVSLRNWNYTEKLQASDYFDYDFTYDVQNKTICFGDGLHGAVPAQGEEILVTVLTTSRFAEGNVRCNEIRTAADAEFSCYIVTNPQNAYGGRDQESTRELLERMQQSILKQERMVSEEDYRNAVFKTPGLMIENVAILPGSIYEKLHGLELGTNEVVLVVRPYSKKQQPRLDGLYLEKIQEYLEDKRLINTKIRVASPVYVGIEVHLKVSLFRSSEEEKAKVRSVIQACIEDEPGNTQFAKKILVGEIAMELELSGAVSRIEELSLERIGQGAKKNDRGDILLQEDALAYLKSMELEFSI